MSRLIPESPSWLLVKGRTNEALKQLEMVARCNKADLQVPFLLCFLHDLLKDVDFWPPPSLYFEGE